MLIIVLTSHAKMRCAQRNVSRDEVQFIVNHAKPDHRAGATFYHLLHKDVPKDDRPNSRYDQLIGTTVVACNQCERYVLTVYRNPGAYKTNAKKRKYDQKKESHFCPCCNNVIVA